MRWLAIINPASGVGKSAKEMDNLISKLAVLTTVIEITEYPGHATEIARRAKQIDAIAVVGGDGTIYESINGMDLHKTTLGIIPVGTGNSLAQNLNISYLMDGLEACRNMSTAIIDLIEVQFQKQNGDSLRCYSTSTIGLGYPANAVKLGNRRFKIFGKACYPISGVVQIFLKNDLDGSFSINGEVRHIEHIKGLFINNTQFAGNFRAFPDAKVDDGLFDVMKMSVGPLRQNIQNLLVLFEQYFYMPSEQFSTDQLHINLEQPQSLMIDGEIYQDVIEVHFRINPKAMRCIHNLVDFVA